MAGLFFALDTLSLNEPEEPEYTVPSSGMTPDAMFSRYIELSDDCMEMEVELPYAERYSNPYLNAKVAKMHSVASVAFLPIPVLPFFPWKAPVR